MSSAIVKHKTNCFLAELGKKILQRDKYGLFNTSIDIIDFQYYQLALEANCNYEFKEYCINCNNTPYTSEKKINKEAEWILNNEQEYLTCLQWEFINKGCLTQISPIIDCVSTIKPEVKQEVFCNVLIEKIQQENKNCDIIVNMSYEKQCEIIDAINQDPLCKIDAKGNIETNVCNIIINKLI